MNAEPGPRHVLAAVWSPVALLLLIATIQIGLATFSGLLPWKGGGFGMFAVADRSETRWVVALEHGTQIAIPTELRALERDVRLLPTNRRMKTLAEALRSDLDLTGEPEIQIWRATWYQQGRSLEARPELLARADPGTRSSDARDSP